jgi:hypothetical protein
LITAYTVGAVGALILLIGIGDVQGRSGLLGVGTFIFLLGVGLRIYGEIKALAFRRSGAGGNGTPRR